MGNFRRIEACRICGNSELIPILELGDLYLTGVFPKSVDEPLTRGPLSLVRCTGGDEACGLVQLQHSYSPTEMYGMSYGYRSSLNGSMVAHLGSKVIMLTELAGLREGDVVADIGSNDGTTLSFYADAMTRIGIDPTAEKFIASYKPGIKVVSDFFSADKFETASGGQKAKVVTSIAMFYDLDDPLNFTDQICRILADDGIWHFEQSYMPLMLDTTGYDTICHEHVEYYALAQIEWMMARSGLRILDVELNDTNGGSFAVTACKKGARRASSRSRIEHIRNAEAERALDTSLPFEEFAGRVERHREELPALLSKMKRSGKLTLGYGASTKGNVLLQSCGITSDTLPFIAEVNAEKFGAFTPGTGIPIISEKEAHAMKPDCFLAMPWHFRSNLLEREQAFIEAGGEMLFPLPAIETVGRVSS